MRKKFSYHLYKPFLLRTWFLTKEQNLFFFRLLYVLFKLFSYPFKYLFFAKKIQPDIVVLNSGSDKISREYFIKKNINVKEIHFINRKLYFQGSVIKKFLISYYILIKQIINSPLTKIYLKKKYMTYIYEQTYKYLIAGIFLSSEKSDIIIFMAYDIAGYNTAYALKNKFYKKRYLVFSNSFIFKSNRYVFLPETTCILCSKVQIEEVSYYKKNNWFKSSDNLYWGSEEAFYEDKAVRPVKTEFDIGLYSSGFWARDNNFFRLSEKNIKENGITKNIYYEMFIELCDLLEEIKKETNYKVVIFPHPFELNLMKSGISLPYEKYDFIKISYENNSIADIYNVKAGISIQSAAILGRWNLGLAGFFYIKNNNSFPVFFKPAYIGKYQKYIFSDINSLKKELLIELNK